jgi:hypothetical protein
MCSLSAFVPETFYNQLVSEGADIFTKADTIAEKLRTYFTEEGPDNHVQLLQKGNAIPDAQELVHNNGYQQHLNRYKGKILKKREISIPCRVKDIDLKKINCHSQCYKQDTQRDLPSYIFLDKAPLWL